MSEPPGASPVPWTQFTQDPRRPDSTALRASDRDRDVVLTVLGESYAEGRLTKEEYDERADRTVGSRTLGELVPLLVDLVPASPPRTPPTAVDEAAARAVRHWQVERRKAVTLFVVVSLICWAVFVPTGLLSGHFPWPLWVMLGTGINVLRVGLQREQIIADERRRLERRQRRAVRS
jgi:uncharacterized membrane protein